MRSALSSVFDEVVDVHEIDSGDSEHLALLKRLELGVTFTKLHCWTLTQYSKCVFMDADTLVLCNIDELFDREEFSAAPDSGWPDCFNSGVFVFQPSLKTFNLLLQFASEHGSFDGGDQGLLNSFFSNWAAADIAKHLPFVYNLSSSAVYTYAPAFQYFGKDAKINLSEDKIEFNNENPVINNSLPVSVNAESVPEMVVNSIYDFSTSNTAQKAECGHEVKVAEPSESPTQSSIQFIRMEMDEITGSVSELTIQPKPEEPSAEDERRKWEEGYVDYMGKDAFENIQKKLDSFLL
ncbi:hypothetical protein lerEdw1_016610 [Lerista edwardsae]|nr:hypothetical protein lerEdw1_016610 [Lerista edwardsae]